MGREQQRSSSDRTAANLGENQESEPVKKEAVAALCGAECARVAGISSQGSDSSQGRSLALEGIDCSDKQGSQSQFGGILIRMNQTL